MEDKINSYTVTRAVLYAPCEKHFNSVSIGAYPCLICLSEENEKLKKDINDLCPVGDLVGLPAWQIEKQLSTIIKLNFYQE